MDLKFKITPDSPKTDSGLTQMIIMGKSIRFIWANEIIERSSSKYVNMQYAVLIMTIL